MNKLAAKVSAYVSDCYQSDLPAYLLYHNIDHIRDVVAHCEQLANIYALDNEDKNLLLIAAWLHDIGHLYTAPERHEEKSVEVMRSFLQNDLPSDRLQLAEQMILATKVSNHPTTLSDAIIRDADTYHLGTGEFFTTDALVRREVELRTGTQIPDWKQRSIAMLKAHEFCTPYCREHLEPGKQENILVLETAD